MVPISLLCDPLNIPTIISYKQFHSLSVQAVYDYKGSLMDVECKLPGSVYDANVFKNSSICKRLRSLNKILQTYLKYFKL